MFTFGREVKKAAYYLATKFHGSTLVENGGLSLLQLRGAWSNQIAEVVKKHV